MQTQATQIIYPESDGLPMADNTKQFEIIVYIKKGLDLLFKNDPNVFIAGDLFWYPVEGQPKIVKAPDIMVVFGRPKGDRGCYKQWIEAHIPPQVVFEIVSPANTPIEMAKKLVFYNDYGVEEYYIYDPDKHELQGWFKNGELYLNPIENMQSWISPRLGVRFNNSSQSLELYGPDGVKIESYEEMEQRLQEKERLLQQYRERFGELS